jgi:hypothetical protein
MYIIKSIRTITTPEGDGKYNYYNAEAKICITDEKGNNEKEAYVLVHWEASMYRFFYACTNESIYDAVVNAPDDEMEVDYIEKFDFIEDAINSEFIDLYRMLDKMLTDMLRGPSRPITHQAKILDTKTEAFVNDAVRNLNLIVHNKFQLALYAPAKIRSFETIEVENLHNTSLHASLTYNIDYDNRNVQNFIRRYRAMFGTEPTQFAFQGYDIAKYFIGMASRYPKSWMSRLDREDTEMLQNHFKFRANGDGGFVNNGIRRIIYGKDYQIEEVL